MLVHCSLFIVHCSLFIVAINYKHITINKLGGAEGDRTPDPLLAKQVLSQLSYSPILVHC